MGDRHGPSDGPKAPLRRVWDWVWEPSLRQLPIGSCPRCGATVVVTSSGRRTRRTFDEAPDEGQMLAACADHGWSPHNERTRRLRAGRRGGAPDS